MLAKVKSVLIEQCPNWNLLSGCWDCQRFDHEKNEAKENCPFHENQTYYSQKRLLYILQKIKINSEFGKFVSERKRLRIKA